jgi:hypothetical protein
MGGAQPPGYAFVGQNLGMVIWGHPDIDPKRVSVIQCDVTEFVILRDRYRGVTVPSCEIKRDLVQSVCAT